MVLSVGNRRNYRFAPVSLLPIFTREQTIAAQLGVITFFRTLFPAKAPGRSGTKLNEASSFAAEQQRRRYSRPCSLKKGLERASLQRDEAVEQSAHQA